MKFSEEGEDCGEVVLLVHPDDLMHKLQVDAHSDDSSHHQCVRG